MRPGGTQTKRGAAVRIRRRLGLAPRAYALLSCSLVLVIAGVSAYGMTVPSMMQAHAAREPRVGHEVKSDLGTTTGYAWASVVGHIVFGAAVRIRRRLGLAPRAYALLSCSLVLVIAGVSAYGMTVPSMMQAHAAREPRVGHEVKSDLGTTTGYAWASVVGHIVFGTDDADGAEAPDNEVTLANGKTIVLTNTKIIDRLSNNSVAATVNKVEQQKEQDAQQSGKPGSSDTSGSCSDSSSSGGGSGSGSSTGGPGNGGSTGGNTDNDANSGGLSAAEEESIHSWLVTKYNMLDGYVSRANDVVSTYNSTGDPRPCDSLVGEMFVIRAEFGRQTFSPRSRWYQQYANLWGCYTNLCQWVGHYGDDDVALGNFNNNVAALAL